MEGYKTHSFVKSVYPVCTPNPDLWGTTCTPLVPHLYPVPLPQKTMVNQAQINAKHIRHVRWYIRFEIAYLCIV
jgi:hypothetical protein